MSDIDEMREKIKKVTLDMVDLLQVRTDMVEELGQAKIRAGKDITDEAQEDNIRRSIVKRCDSIGLDEGLALRFLNFLLDESYRVQSRKKGTHMEIFLKAKTLEAQGKKIIHMEVGEPDFSPPGIVRESLEKVYDEGFLKYGQATGMPAFREALAKHIAKEFGANVLPENIIVSPGARFSIFAAISTLLNPGDEMIVIEPAWPAYKDCASNARVKARIIKTTAESGWTPSLDQIKGAVNPGTKMIILNYPNNPTGKILDEKLMDDIMDIAKANDLYVISDEIYYQYAKTPPKSVLSYNYKKSIVTGSFSKSHAMTGFRIGYAVADASIIEKMARLEALCLTNVSEPIQYIAMQALKADTSENTKIIQDRIDVLVEKAKKMGLDFIVPDGSMYLFAGIRQKGFDGSQFALDALDRGVAVAPGEGFGHYGNFIRISACQDKQTLIDGMDILQSMITSSEDQ